MGILGILIKLIRFLLYLQVKYWECRISYLLFWDSPF